MTLLDAPSLGSDLTASEELTLARAFEMVRTATKDKSYLELPMGREVGRYLAAKRKELTASSFIGYESSLDKFARQFPHLGLEQMEVPDGPELIEVWMDQQWGDAAPGTYNVIHSHLSDFFKWQQKRQRMRSNPMELVGRAKKRDRHRTTFTDSQRTAIIQAANLRDRICLRLLFDHGIRKGALRAIQFKHFNYPRRRVVIFTKGQKVREIPIPHPAFWTDLEQHIIEVEAKPDDFLLCLVKPIPNVGVKRFGFRPLSNTAAHRWWYARLNDAGIVAKNTTGTERTMSMHVARHTAGQRVLDKTGDLKLVQKILGHQSIQTTADVYVDYDIDQVAAKLGPLLEEDDG